MNLFLSSKSTVIPIIVACLLLQQMASARFNPVPYSLPESSGTDLGYAQFINADLDADGTQDAVTFYTARGVYWRRGLGATDLTQPPLGPAERLMSLSQTFDLVRIADLDGDGYPDIVCASANHPQNENVYWLRNLCGESGSVVFDQAPRLISTAFSDITALFLEDIDSDGDTDVITGSNFGTENFHIHTNNLNEFAGSFGVPILLFAQGRYLDNRSVVFHDYDSDGDLDVATRQSLAGGKETIVWLENQLHDLTAYTLFFPPNPVDQQDLPTSSLTPRLVIATIQGELWLRFLKPDAPPLTFREFQLNADPQDMVRLKADLEIFLQSVPDPFLETQLKKRITRITGYKSSEGIQFVRHELFSGPIPASVQPNTFRYYAPQQFISSDVDGDGDTDFFTAYTGSYGPMMGWFENRLNERNHQNFSSLQLMNIDLYGGNAVIAHLDANDLPDLIFQGTDATLRVLYDFRGLRDGLPSWSEVVKKHGMRQHNSNPVGLCATIDLDADGDLEILSDLSTFTGTFFLISENLGSKFPPATFDRHETKLIEKLPPYDSYPYLRAADRNGDGRPDLSMGGTYTYRNQYSSPPTFDFARDTSLGEFPSPLAVPSVDFAPFDQWHEAQPWQRTGRTISRLLADINLDGDTDVVMLHGVPDGPTSVSWFENRTTDAPDYRGPLGISGNVDESTKMICVDFDSDGDPDILATGYYVDVIKYPRVIAFQNLSSHDELLDRFVVDTQGFYQNSLTNPSFSAKLKSSPDLNWQTAETTEIPALHLGNPAAMKHHMKWLDPIHEKRFYRLEYTIVK